MNKFSALLVNIRLWIRNRPIRVQPYNGSIYRVFDQTGAIFACQPQRYNRYKRGIETSINKLAKDYHLHQLNDINGGTFIDCGANVGELGIWTKLQGLNYIAFEPEALEAQCCQLNNSGSRINKNALWKETKNLTFYSKARTADSSIIPPLGTSQKSSVDAIKLDDYIQQAVITRPVILKVEAEGAEPEVLTGAKLTLAICDYVTVDWGYERGTAQENTFASVNSMLTAHDFQLVEISTQHRFTALYQKL